jgi:hypothetical protein
LKKNVYIDTQLGGLGDVWMRLSAFYTFAQLRPDCTLHLKIPKSLQNIAMSVFGDRLLFVTEDIPYGYTYTARGFLDLWKEVLKGKKFIAPYHRIKHAEGKGNWLKKQINNVLMNTCNALGFINLPRWESLHYYQGYMEAEAIPEFKSIRYADFLIQSKKDFQILQDTIKTIFQNTDVSAFPDLRNATVVFPSGTAHQYMPVEFAVKELPNALYFFHAKDTDQQAFKEAGLSVFSFHTAEEIAAIGLHAKISIATDSFPSHIIQYCPSYSILTLAEVPGTRTVSPHYPGIKIESQAPCCPCLHTEKKGFPLCEAGFTSCLTWKQDGYVKQLKSAVGK